MTFFFENPFFSEIRPPRKSSKSDRCIGDVKIHERNQKSLEGVNDFRQNSRKVQTRKTALRNTPGKQKKQKKIFRKQTANQ